MAQYSEYRHSLFSNVKNDQVSNCLSNVLRAMSVKCAVFFTNDSDSLEKGLTYYFAVKIFDCYLFQSDSESCASTSQVDVVNCITKHSDRVQIAFHEYLDEVKPLCCYFKLYNDSMKPITEILSERLSNDLPGLWSSIKSGFHSFQSLPSGLCKKYWVIEALLSQLFPFPFCYCEKHFVTFQFWFLGIFVSIGALYGWWKQKTSAIEDIFGLGPFETPFFYYPAPCVFQANLEIMIRLFLSNFWPRFPALAEHILILLTRYETVISLLFDTSLLRIFLQNFPQFFCFLFNGMINIAQWIVCKKLTDEQQAVLDIRNRWEQAGASPETQSTPQTHKTKNQHATLEPISCLPLSTVPGL